MSSRALLATILASHVATAAPRIAIPRVASADLSASVDGPDATIASDVSQMTLRDGVIVDYPGATAAFSVDPRVVEASAHNGRVTFVARGVGTTTISIVTPTGFVSFSLTVVAPAPWLEAATDAARARTWTVWEGQYETQTSRLTNSLEMVDSTAHRTLRAYAVNVLRLDQPATTTDADARTALPALALEYRARKYDVIAFDQMIDHSQLTLDGVTVRGAHVRAGGLEVHAGVTSPVLYQNVFLSTQREYVLGASYEIALDPRSSLTPNLYAYPGDPQTGGSDGTISSLLYRYHSKGDHLQLRSELGWGGRVGAAGELTYQDATNRAWISARHEPRGFAALGVGRPLGSVLDALYTAEPSKELTVNVTTTAARYQVGAHDQDVVTASVEGKHKLAAHVAASLGMSSGQFDGGAMAETVRSITVPVGLHIESPRFGASAIYRYQQNSARNAGGHGGRLSARVTGDGVLASVFADAQQEAATVDLVLREEPQLAQLLDELGLTAASPDDLARLIRENATLAQLGYTDGAHLDFNPWRAQLGGDLAWQRRDASRQQLRVRALVNRTKTVTSEQQTTMLSLAYSRRFGRNVDVSGMASWWTRGGDMTTRDHTVTFVAGMRVKLDSVPHLPSWQRRELAGVVVDESGDAPLAGVTVRLDGGRSARTDGSGRFTFADVTRGEHRVEAEALANTYFLGASRVTAEAGDPVRFVLARAASRISGTITDDVGDGVAGVSVLVRGPSGEHTLTSDARGHWAVAVGAGTYEITPVPESVPSGYDVSELLAQSVPIGTGEILVRDAVVRANRSISGTVRGSREKLAAARIRIVELDQAGTLDAGGRYVFRRLKPGHYTVEVAIGGTTLTRALDVPGQPASIAGIDFP